MENMLIWGDIATWVTGIATIALFIIGFIQIRNERNARLTAEKEARIHSRRNQAENISCWIVKENLDGIWVAVLNQSLQPVYQAIVNIVVIGPMGSETTIGGFEGKEFIALVPPGMGYTILHAGYHGMHRRPGVEIAFMDSSEHTWIRKSEGRLIELNQSSMEYFDIIPPVSWSNLFLEIPDSLYNENDNS